MLKFAKPTFFVYTELGDTMYRLEKALFSPKDKFRRDSQYLIDILKRFGAEEEEDVLLLPDEVVKPLEDANLGKDVYNFFELVWADTKKDVNIEDIVGSHDFRNLNLKTWLENFLLKDVGKYQLEEYLQNPKAIFEGDEKRICLFEKDGKYYVADGHHRFSALYLHYHILKSKNQLPEDFPVILPAIVRVVPKNMDFVKRFNSFCIENNLYYEDEEGTLPIFLLEDSNPEFPVIRYPNTDIVIDPTTNLEEVLEKLNEARSRKV